MTIALPEPEENSNLDPDVLREDARRQLPLSFLLLLAVALAVLAHAWPISQVASVDRLGHGGVAAPTFTSPATPTPSPRALRVRTA
jgi:hypothetical protein